VPVGEVRLVTGPVLRPVPATATQAGQAAQTMNHMLRPCAGAWSPDGSDAFQDEAWPALMEIVRGVQAPPG